MLKSIMYMQLYSFYIHAYSIYIWDWVWDIYTIYQIHVSTNRIKYTYTLIYLINN